MGLKQLTEHENEEERRRNRQKSYQIIDAREVEKD